MPWHARGSRDDGTSLFNSTFGRTPVDGAATNEKSVACWVWGQAAKSRSLTAHCLLRGLHFAMMTRRLCHDCNLQKFVATSEMQLSIPREDPAGANSVSTSIQESIDAILKNLSIYSLVLPLWHDLPRFASMLCHIMPSSSHLEGSG